MKMSDAVVVWTPRTDLCRVERHLSGSKRTKGDRWQKADRCYDSLSSSPPANDDQKLMLLFILFNTLVMRDKVDVQAAHRAFLEIDEYRQYRSPDQQGAERYALPL